MREGRRSGHRVFLLFVESALRVAGAAPAASARPVRMRDDVSYPSPATRGMPRVREGSARCAALLLFFFALLQTAARPRGLLAPRRSPHARRAMPATHPPPTLGVPRARARAQRRRIRDSLLPFPNRHARAFLLFFTHPSATAPRPRPRRAGRAEGAEGAGAVCVERGECGRRRQRAGRDGRAFKRPARSFLPPGRAWSRPAAPRAAPAPPPSPCPSRRGGEEGRRPRRARRRRRRG